MTNVSSNVNPQRSTASAVPPQTRTISDPTTKPQTVATPASASSSKTSHNTTAQNPAQTCNQQQRPNQIPSRDTPRPANIPSAPASSTSSGLEKRVTFAQQPPNDAPKRVSPPAAPIEAEPESFEDESFGLNSEDDDFFASVDLGDGLGGPIHFDEGLGGVDSPIDEGPSVLGGYQTHRVAVQTSHASHSNPPAKTLQGQPPQQSSAQNAQPVYQPHLPPGPGSNLRTSSQAGGFHFPPGMVRVSRRIDFALPYLSYLE